MTKKLDYTIQSVQRALKVLKLFDYNHKDMTLTEISTLADIRKGTMIRILTTLEEEGFVRFDERTRRYQLGFAIYKLATTAYQFTDIVQIARPHLVEVTSKLKLVAHLASVHGDKIILIDRVLPQNNFNVYDLNSTIGGEIEVHCTGVGKVIAAFANQELRNKLLENCSFEKHSEKTITNCDDFTKSLEQVRKDKYAVNCGENEEYLKCITYPIFDYDGEICAALSLTGIINNFSGELEEQSHIELKRITQTISKTLGYTI